MFREACGAPLGTHLTLSRDVDEVVADARSGREKAGSRRPHLLLAQLVLHIPLVLLQKIHLSVELTNNVLHDSHLAILDVVLAARLMSYGR